MRAFTTYMVIVALISLGAGVASANPVLMRKNIPGYPYPGTAAVDHFGTKAMSEAVHQANRDDAGIVTGQTLDTIRSKSLLPPPGDPKRLNPFAGAQQPSADMLKSPLRGGD